MIYEINQKLNSIRILGDKFVSKNKYKYILIHNNKIKLLDTKIFISSNYKENTFNIKLISLKNDFISNKAYMFDKCYSLV